MTKNFALIGAAGYVAPRHMKAIQDCGGNLHSALDKNDSVGVLDSYFPNTSFFTEFERFDRHIEKLKRQGVSTDYISICSPNYLHDSHIRFALRSGANAICEKPLVLNPWNLDALNSFERETGKKIYTILQLRLHPEIKRLKERINREKREKKYEVELTYITSRGNWYYASWKGDEKKSGGITTNIGIHFFDVLGYLFGELRENKLHVYSHDRAAGFLEYEKARVRWFLSINFEMLPKDVKEEGKGTFRCLTVDKQEVDFSKGFEQLHTKSYSNIMSGNGFGISEARKAIETVYEIRNNEKNNLLKGEYHPLAKIKLSKHPFKRTGLII